MKISEIQATLDFSDCSYIKEHALHRNKIIEKLQNKEYHNHITYDKKHTGAVICNQSDIDNWFEKNKDDIFFRKSEEWNYEQEYRIIKKCSTNNEEFEYINFDNALIAVIMCYAPGVSHDQSFFCSENYKKLKRLTDVPILEYGYLFNIYNLRDCLGNSIWSNEDINMSYIDI